MAMRRNRSAEQFPADVQELAHYLGDSAPDRRVRAIPGEGSHVPLWILGSSLYGAQLAAHLGLPYAFASHFAPQQMMDAIHLYRSTFRPSSQLDEPYVMLGFNVFAADTDEEARLLSTSLQQAFFALRTGQPGKLKPPVEGFLDQLPMQLRLSLEEIFRHSAIGSPTTVRAQIEAFIALTQADELMITSQIFDHQARRRSFEILAESVGMRSRELA